MSTALNQALRAEANMFRAARTWTEASGGGISDSGTIVSTTCPARLRSFNQLFVKGASLDAEELATIVDVYRRQHPRFRLRVRGDLEVAVAPAIIAAGLERRGGIPSMVLEEPSKSRVGAESLQIGPVADERSLAGHVSVVAEAFDWQPEVLSTVFTPRLLSDNCWVGWVGSVDDEPVAAAQLVVHEGVGGIYYVATVEAHRGCGFGGAITSCAVGEAVARGCDIVSLQASPAGYPIYAGMGFRKVADYVRYVDVEHSN